MLDVHLGPDDAAIRQIELGHVDVQAAFLPEVIEPVVAAIVDVRNPFLDPGNAREALLPHQAALIVAVTARPIEEADFRIEIAADLNVARDIKPMRRLIRDPRAVRDSIRVRAGVRRRRAPPVDRPRVADTDAAVDPEHAIPVVGFGRRDALHADDTHARSRGEFAADTQDRIRHRLLPGVVALREDLEAADGQSGQTSGEPAAADDRNRTANIVDPDTSGEEQIHRLRRARREDPRVFEEERTLLGKEQRKPREVGAYLVDLDLGEVGVIREIERETLRHAQLHLTAELAALVGFPIDDEIALCAEQGVRSRGQNVARRHLHALQRSRPRDFHQAVLPRNERPERLFVLAANRAHEVQTPRLGLRGAIAQRRKRNAELGVPPGRVDRGGDGPGGVPIEIEPAERTGGRPRLPRQLNAATLALVHDLPVVLDPRRGGGEYEAVLPIVIGIEHHAEIVALGDVAVPYALTGNDASSLPVVQPRADVDRFAIDENADFSPLGNGLAFVQLALEESGNSGCGLPHRVGQTTVDNGRRGDGARGSGRWMSAGTLGKESHKQREHESGKVAPLDALRLVPTWGSNRRWRPSPFDNRAVHQEEQHGADN